MRTRFKLALAAIAATLASTLAIAGAAQAASSPSTPVHLSPAQVSQTLFVAGDVGRLSVIPSGTESVVLEKVLQQLYTNNPTLASSQAVSEIQGLQAALASGTQAISPATLTVMGGNERILAILRALTASNPTPEVQHALAQVANQALTVSEQSTQFLGQSFDASADSLDTLSFSAFSPAGTLAHSAALASSHATFGQARDAIWRQASNEARVGFQRVLVKNAGPSGIPDRSMSANSGLSRTRRGLEVKLRRARNDGSDARRPEPKRTPRGRVPQRPEPKPPPRMWSLLLPPGFTDRS